jgi:two-component system NarL family sensor kinase
MNILVLMILVLGAVIFAGMCFFYKKNKWVREVNHKQQKIENLEMMLRLTMEQQEKDRKKLSRDLHENIGPLLQALNLTVAHTADQILRKQVQEMVNDMTHTIRQLSWALLPQSLERFGLAEALEEFCHQLQQRHPQKIFIQKNTESIQLDKNKQIHLYRIVEEGITNAIKHAEASQINVNLHQGKRDVRVTISDNGIGFNFSGPDQSPSHQYNLGIYNMRCRVDLLRGTLYFSSNQPKGTRLIIQIPLHGSI